MSSLWNFPHLNAYMSINCKPACEPSHDCSWTKATEPWGDNVITVDFLGLVMSPQFCCGSSVEVKRRGELRTLDSPTTQFKSRCNSVLGLKQVGHEVECSLYWISELGSLNFWNWLFHTLINYRFIPIYQKKIRTPLSSLTTPLPHDEMLLCLILYKPCVGSHS